MNDRVRQALILLTLAALCGLVALAGDPGGIFRWFAYFFGAFGLLGLVIGLASSDQDDEPAGGPGDSTARN